MSQSRRHRAIDSSDALISRLTKRWRAEAETLHRRGADEQALVLKSCADELTEEGRLYSLEELTLEQAVAESGYSYSALQKMVGKGIIPNVNKLGSPRVRRGDLPKKATRRARAVAGTEPDLAGAVLGLK